MPSEMAFWRTDKRALTCLAKDHSISRADVSSAASSLARLVACTQAQRQPIPYVAHDDKQCDSGKISTASTPAHSMQAGNRNSLGSKSTLGAISNWSRFGCGGFSTNLTTFWRAIVRRMGTADSTEISVVASCPMVQSIHVARPVACRFLAKTGQIVDVMYRCLWGSPRGRCERTLGGSVCQIHWK